MQLPTFSELVELQAAKFGNKKAFQIRDGESWRCYSFQQVAEYTKKLQQQLIAASVNRGDRVALISENRPEWPIAYLAITGLGAVVVPLDAMLKKEELLPLVADSGAKVVILSRPYVDYFDLPCRILMEEYDRLPAAPPSRGPAGALDDLASIVYTSGTTGTPKGVMLTQRNIIFNVASTVSVIKILPADNWLSVLPLHHTFETTAGFIGAYFCGSTVTYAESLKSHHLLRNMKETGTTIMCGVPLLYQLLYDGIMREVEEQGKTKLFDALLSVARFFQRFIGCNIGKLLFGVVHKKFGGRIRFFVSGGAALDAGLAANFELLGFTILQGYGLTESAPILTCCTLEKNKLGAAGRAIPGVEIRITGNDAVGEILATGPNIMQGYYQQKELTARVLINGWLHTGDVGYLDEEGFLFITGRSKDVIVTAAGVNVYPEEIEVVLNRLPVVKESCILGEKIKEGIRKGSEEVLAVIVPNHEYLERNGLEDEAAVIGQAVQTYNRQAADYKRIARYILRRTELPKTRILKIKRFEVKKELGL